MSRSSRRQTLERRLEEMESSDRRSRWIFIALVAAFAIAIAAVMIQKQIASGPLELNRASAEKLETLPGVGPDTANAIIKGRPYETIDDLDKVKGIGPATIEKLRDKVKIFD